MAAFQNVEMTITIPFKKDKPDLNKHLYTKEALQGAVDSFYKKKRESSEYTIPLFVNAGDVQLKLGNVKDMMVKAGCAVEATVILDSAGTRELANVGKDEASTITDLNFLGIGLVAGQVLDF